jgi:hypothetical protein
VVPAELECEPGSLAADSILDYSGYSSGMKGDPEDLARQEMEGIKPDDVLSTTRYPDPESPEVAVRRDGNIIAIVRFTPTDDGGLVIGSFEACDNANIRY